MAEIDPREATEEPIPRGRAIYAILASFVLFFFIGLAIRSDGQGGRGIEAWARKTEPFRSILNSIAPEPAPTPPPPSVKPIPIPNTAEAQMSGDSTIRLIPYEEPNKSDPKSR